MLITVIHGQNHKGSTYTVAKILTDSLGGEVTEFFLPRDFGSFCVGCTNCFERDEKLCPHYEKLKPLADAMKAADVIILDSPVYVYHCSGQMKTFLDHFGYMWIVHRPEKSMFTKQGVCITTAAGAGMKSAEKDMADSMFFWGVGKIYRLGFAVRAVNWKSIPEKRKDRIQRKVSRLSSKIKSNYGRVKPGIKTRAFFNLMRMLHKKGFSEIDDKYWESQGWFGKSRPWNN